MTDHDHNTIRFCVSHASGAFYFDAPFWLSDEQAIRHAKSLLPPVLREMKNPRVERTWRWLIPGIRSAWS